MPDGLCKHGDYRLNVYNTLAVNELSSAGLKSVCLSPEMTIKEMSKISTSLPREILVYGKISLMTVKNCLVKSSLKKCGCKDGEFFYLRDRKNINFPVQCIKGECVNVIYNSAPLYMGDRLNELSKINASFYRFDFTDETPKDIYSILNQYESGKKSSGFFTRGHFYNGVN